MQTHESIRFHLLAYTVGKSIVRGHVRILRQLRIAVKNNLVSFTHSHSPLVALCAILKNLASRDNVLNETKTYRLKKTERKQTEQFKKT